MPRAFENGPVEWHRQKIGNKSAAAGVWKVNMKKSIILAVALMTALIAGGLVTLQAQDGASAPACWRQRGWADAQKKIGLTDEQVAKIKAELRPEKEALTTLSLRQHDARIALRETVQKAGATEAEVRAAAAKTAAVEADLAVLKANLHARIAPLMTKEQLDKINARQRKMDDFADAMIVGFIDRMVR